MFRILSWAPSVAATIGTVVFTWLFLASHSEGWRAVWLYLTCLWPIIGLLHAQAALFCRRVLIPRYARKKLAHAMGAIAAAAFYLSRTPLTWRSMLASLIAVWSFYQVGILVILSVSALRSASALRRQFGRTQAPRLPVPYVYVIYTTNAKLVERVVPMLLQALWRFRYRPEGALDQLARDSNASINHITKSGSSFSSALPAILRETARILVESSMFGRVFLTCLDAADLGSDPAFSDFVAANAAACLVFPGMFGQTTVRLHGDDLMKFLKALGTGPGPLKALAAIGTGVLDPQLATDPWIEELAARETDLVRRMLMCRGPVIVFLLSQGESVGVTLPEDAQERMRGYDLATGPLRAEWIVPASVEVLGSTAYPIARADRALDDRLRNMCAEIATVGLAPVADAYLRFRLAKSDIERFLCLLDCFEALIRMSALVLTDAGNLSKREMMIQQLARPSLGDWTMLLSNEVRNPTTQPTELRDSIRAAWKSSIPPSFKDFFDAVNGSGLSWKDIVPRSHLKWLEWLTWLRNSTRGHGVMDETGVGTTWQQAHATFLQMAADLHALTLDSSIVSGASVQAGWLKAGSRPKQSPASHVQTALDIGLVHHGEYYAMSPFIMMDDSACLVWNKAIKNGAVYIDYGNGRLVTYPATLERGR